MELTDHDRRMLAGSRDRLLMEQIEQAELATTREEAFHASYLEVVDKHLAVVDELRISEARYQDCHAALRRAQWLAGALFLIALAAVVRAW